MTKSLTRRSDMRDDVQFDENLIVETDDAHYQRAGDCTSDILEAYLRAVRKHRLLNLDLSAERFSRIEARALLKLRRSAKQRHMHEYIAS